MPPSKNKKTHTAEFIVNTDIQPILAVLKPNNIYRQATQGCLFYLSAVMDGALSVIKPTFQVEYLPKERFENIFTMKDLIAPAQKILQSIQKPKSAALAMYQTWQQRLKKHDALYKKLMTEKIHEFSIDHIFGRLHQYIKTTDALWAIGLIIDCFDPIDQQILQTEIFAKIKRELTEEEKAVLLANTELTTPLLLEHAALKALIRKQKNITQNLQKQFYWMNNDYLSVSEIPAVAFTPKVADIRAQFPTLTTQRQRIKELECWGRATRSKKNALMRQLKFSDRQKGIILTLTTLKDWREARKRNVQKMFILLQKYIDRLAQLTNIPASHIKCMDYRERYLLADKAGADRLKSRYENGLLYALNNATMERIIIDDPGQVALFAKRYNKLLLGEAAEISGNIAYAGKASGIVKVILHPNDFVKFNQGDILVTAMTRPEFIPIIHKAAGIITDEGGITCHAAVVSREFKIPCIVGTQNATLKLKDGDMVVVDGRNGIIKKL